MGIEIIFNKNNLLCFFVDMRYKLFDIGSVLFLRSVAGYSDESELVRKLKGRTGRKLLMEFPQLKKRYSGGHMWAIGYGAWSTGVVSQDLINEYLEHHRQQSNENDDEAFIE